jgi:hypothetical protein
VQTLARQDVTNSRGFKEGEGVRVKADAKLPKKLSYACCCTGVVARIERLITLQLDPTKNFESHCILVKPEWLENLPGKTSVAESVLVSQSRDASIQNSTSLPPATQTTMLKISCSSDTQEPPASKTCGCGHQSAKTYQQLSLLQQVPLVSTSPFRENGLASRTNETISPQLLERSPTELLENDVTPSVTPSIQELQISPDDEFSTSIPRLAPEIQDDCQHLVEKRRGRRKCSPNKKPASGSLVRCVSVKKGKEYSTWQYNYDVRDPDSKRGWQTIKEGVPKYKVPAIADAIEAGLPIPEILALLGKELQGQISS